MTTPAIGRLRRRPEFLRVAGGRRRWVAPGLILQTRRRDTGPEADASDRRAAGEIRVGFTASRKVGKAVERNRARRRLRAVAGKLLPCLGEAGHDYVLIARAGTLTRSYRDLVGDLRTALERTSAKRKPRGR